MNLALNSNLIVGFILLQPVLDLLTSVMIRTTGMSITIGLIVRSLFMAYLTIYVLFTKNNSNKYIKYSKVVMLLLLGYIVIFLGMSVFGRDRSLVIGEVKGLIKAFYFPITLCGLFVANTNEKINISNKILMLTLFGYTVVIFLATTTNTYFNSYNRNGYGSVGWFYAANEIGSIISILIPFTIANIIQSKHTITNTIAIIVCICSVMFLGTKVPFLGLVGVCGFVVIYYTVLKLIKIKYKSNTLTFNYKKIVSICIGIVILMTLMFPFSPLYKNIQRNYSGIINRIISSINGEKIESKEEVEDKEPVSKDELVTAILSKRTIYADQMKVKFKEGKLSEKLFGLGYNVKIIAADGQTTTKTIELDQLDILYRHGIIGTMIYFSQFVIILIILLKRILFSIGSLLNIDVIMSIISMILSLGIAFSAGHVLTAPGVGIFLIIVTIKLYNIMFDYRINM